MPAPILKFLKLRIKLGLSRGVLLANIGAFTGSGGAIGTGFGIELPPGIAIETLQWTVASKSRDGTQRHEAQMILAGVTTKLGPLKGSIKFGSAGATATASSPDDFGRSRQQALTIGSVGLSYPIKLTERLALTLTAGQLKTLSAGTPPTWEHQTYLSPKGPPGARARLGLTSNSTMDKPEPSHPRPGDFLGRITMLGIGLNLEIP
jgi:hypothetical protein